MSGSDRGLVQTPKAGLVWDVCHLCRRIIEMLRAHDEEASRSDQAECKAATTLIRYEPSNVG